jgi:hypothetical protein
MTPTAPATSPARRSLRPSALLLIPLAGLVVLRLALAVVERGAEPELPRAPLFTTTAR